MCMGWVKNEHRSMDALGPRARGAEVVPLPTLSLGEGFLIRHPYYRAKINDKI